MSDSRAGRRGRAPAGACLMRRDHATLLDPRLEFAKPEAHRSVGGAEAHARDPPRVRSVVEPRAGDAKQLDHLRRLEEIYVRLSHRVHTFQAAERPSRAIGRPLRRAAALSADVVLKRMRLVGDRPQRPERVARRDLPHRARWSPRRGRGRRAARSPASCRTARGKQPRSRRRRRRARHERRRLECRSWCLAWPAVSGRLTGVCAFGFASP